MFFVMAPSYKIFSGKSIATSIPFLIIPTAYVLMFFGDHVTDPQLRKTFKHAQNHNETHYASMVLALLLGVSLRRFGRG